jgi:hypothetical protein
MCCRLSAAAGVAATLLFPTLLIAGGPPRLCLPIDGVKADQVEACSKLLAEKLAGKISPDPYGGVRMHEYKDQRYFSFYMGEEVSLSQIEAALEGSGFSVPRGRLRLFGHAILEVEAGDAVVKPMLTALEKLDHVSVDQSQPKHEKERLLVTVDMPYPTDDRPREERVGWGTFARCDFSSDQATLSEPTTTAEKLPDYGAFRDVLAKNNASLKDIRWNPQYACRPQGGVAVAPREAVAAAKAAKAPASKAK